MMLSSILDIGSFFIGMIINLLLVTLMCYYFKKKYESLEEAQNEQAKLLYELLQDRKQDRAPVKPTMIDMQEIEVSDEESDTVTFSSAGTPPDSIACVSGSWSSGPQ